MSIGSNHGGQRRAILVSTAAARLCGDALEAALPAGVDILPFEPGVPLTPAELASVEAAFMSSDIVGDSSRTRATPAMQAFCDALEAAPRLRWLQLSMAGVDRPIFARLAARGVRLSTAAGAASETVAVTALTGLLALSRRVPLWIQAQAAREWVPMRTGALEPRELRGQRVLIVGTGRIGTELARLCQAVGLVTHGLRHRGRDPLPHFDEVGTTDDLVAAVARADWVVAACPLTSETTGLFHREVFAAFKPTASFINVARGAVAREADLVEALSAGTVESAYLDVFEVEPLPVASPLWTLPNVLMSAHSAGDTTGRHGRIAEMFLNNLRCYVDEQPLVNEVDASQLLPLR